LITFLLGFIFFDIVAFSCDTFKLDIPDIFSSFAAYDDDFFSSGSPSSGSNNYWDDDFWNRRRLQSFPIDPDDLGYGYWGYQYGGSCETMTGADVDGVIKAGRAIGVIGCLLSFFGIVFLLCAFCIRIPRGLVVAMGCIQGILMCIFTLILPIGLAAEGCALDDHQLCIPDVKFYLMIPAFLCFLVGSSTMCCCMKPREVPVPMAEARPVA
jgi:hypothetical protein